MSFYRLGSMVINEDNVNYVKIVPRSFGHESILIKFKDGTEIDIWDREDLYSKAIEFMRYLEMKCFNR